MNRPFSPQLPPFHGSDSGTEPTEQQRRPSHDALPPGTRLGEYELLSVLGEGQFGTVYLAMDHGLQRQVAIKEYLPAALASRGRGTMIILRSDRYAETFALGLESFVAEARLLARFDHPALMRVYRSWEANGTAYMVMPYYEGATLDVVRKSMARPPDEAWLRGLLLPLLDALELLHGASCYPRDISPQNILLLPDGRPVLLDLGAARHVIGDRTEALTAVLKPAFAPIEQYAESANLRQGPWSNLYALAAVAYYCVGGDAPVPSTVRALDDRLEPLFQVVDRLGGSFPELDYSVALISAIERALRVRPEERPQSVAEFRRALLDGRGGAESIVTARATAEVEAAAGAAQQRTTAREARSPFVSPSGHHPREPFDDADDDALRAAVEAALNADPDDFGKAPQPEGDSSAGGAGRALFVGIAAAALAVLGVGGWMMWSDDHDANEALRSIAARELPQQQPSPPAPAAEVPTTVSSGVVAEPPLPESESTALPAPAEAPPEEAITVTEAAAETPGPQPAPLPEEAPDSPPEIPTVSAEAPKPPPAKVVKKAPDNNPRTLCGPRTQFSLYRCMKAACDRPKYYGHPECKYLRATDEVRPLR